MKRLHALVLTVSFGCSNDPQPVSASMVEIPPQPPQPPAAAAPPTVAAPPATPSVSAEPEAEPWANGLPPASGTVAPAKPVSSVSGPCVVPYVIDPSTGRRKYKAECVANAKPVPPPRPYKPPPIK
jgi:hypothetical protein